MEWSFAKVGGDMGTEGRVFGFLRLDGEVGDFEGVRKMNVEEKTSLFIWDRFALHHLRG